MSTIASPRASTDVRSASSSRTSLDLPTTTRPQTQRRNRAALRDYYGLKASADAEENATSPPPVQTPRNAPAISQLDSEGFDAPAYIKAVLAKESLEGVLRIEGELISEIKNLDGERKALVYDNYSKLIAATDTIRRMRTNMDPLTPATSTLSPAIAHIAETAATLSSSLIDRTGRANGNGVPAAAADGLKDQRATVRWVLDTPRRMEVHLDNGDKEAAEAEYTDVEALLDHWEGVKGVEELRRKCQELLQEDD